MAVRAGFGGLGTLQESSGLGSDLGVFGPATDAVGERVADGVVDVPAKNV